MTSIVNPELLTPNIFFESGIRLQAGDGSFASNGETIKISVCSEFTTYHSPATTVNSKHKPGIALDTNHQPVVFAIGNEGRFFCIRRVESESWKATDITPGNNSTTAITFDIYQHSAGKVAIAVATTDASSSTAPTIHFAKPFVLTKDLDPTKITFSHISNEPSVQIASMKVAASDPELQKPCFIIVGTKSTASERAIDYIVPTDPSASKAWEPVSLPEQATQVFKVLPIVQRSPIDACVASLYQQNRSDGSTQPGVGTAISCLGLGAVDADIFVPLDNLKGGRDMASTVTEQGLSDLYVAGVQGIGYFASQKMSYDPVILLPEISFEQIVASENKGKISIFAVSKNGDLYYIEGTRKPATATAQETVGFDVPKYPIRKQVGSLSTQYNAEVNACEAMYTDNEHLKHLWRDSISQTWTEQTIHIQDLGKSISYPAFISQIHVQGSKGTAIRQGYEISLSATELTYVVINDIACRLDKNPVKFNFDSQGTIRVIIQVGPQLGAPTITGVFHGKKDPDYSFIFEPSQRVLRKWATTSIRSGSDIKNARSTDGKLIFPNTKIDDKSFETAAQLLQQTPSLIAHFDKQPPVSTGQHPNATFSDKTVHVSPSATALYSAFSATSILDDWIHSAEEGIGAAGDFFESVWNGVVGVARFTIKVLGNVVNLFAEIAGKAFRWVINSIGSVVRCVCTFLKDVLGIDLTHFLAMFGFLFDYPNVLKTQQVIVKTVKDGSSLLQDVVKDNVGWMTTHIQQLRPLISQHIKDERVPETKNFIQDAKSSLEDSFLGKLLKSVLDNPIINAVMKYASMWMLQVVSLLEEEISFPGISDLEKLLEGKFTGLLEKFLVDTETGLFNFIRDIFNGIAEVISGKRNIGDFFRVVFSDIFWSIFDTAQDVTLALVDMLPGLIASIVKVITSPIKFPGISVFWESFTETPFSIVDIGSMILAQVLYLVTMMWQEKLPFEVMTPWDTLIPQKGSIHFPTIDIAHNPPKLDKIEDAEDAEDAEDSEEIEVTEQSESEKVLPYMMADLGIGIISSLCSMLNSGLELGILHPKGRMEGYNMDALGQSEGSPEIKANRTALPFIQNLQLGLSGLGLLTKIALFVNGLIRPGAFSIVTERVLAVQVCKLVAVAMSGIGLSARIVTRTKGASYKWAAYLAPVGNIIGTLPAGIWSFVDSKKTAGDTLLLSTSVLNTIAAGCDITTTVLSQDGQELYKWVPFGISAVLNIGQTGTTVWYYCDYKPA